MAPAPQRSREAGIFCSAASNSDRRSAEGHGRTLERDREPAGPGRAHRRIEGCATTCGRRRL